MENPPLQLGSIHCTLNVQDEIHTLCEEKVLHPNTFQVERLVAPMGRDGDLS